MRIAPETFARRRQRFMQAIGEGAAAIFPAAPESVRSHDVEYRYRQDSDFHYLTGFSEPGAVCLLLPGHPKHEYVLFVRPRDPERETWTGKRAGVEGAVSDFQAGMAHPIEQLDEKMREYLAERERWFYVVGRDELFSRRVLGWLQHAQGMRPRTGSGPTALSDPRELLHEMRLFKEPEEIKCMRRAAAISAEAHIAAMRTASPGRPEYEIEALVDYKFRRGGASGPAYPTIVASGANATILHYISNDCAMQKDALLLLDAGAEYELYCADITRTTPIGPRFEGRGKALYEIVLHAQVAAIEMIRPGVRVDEVHDRAVSILVDGLLQLGLLSGSAEEVRTKELYKPFYMHRTSHWLGMDVHDVGKYKIDGKSRLLEPGMVLTVEPGLYIGEHVADIGPEWRGYGIRIEDDVLVTAEGHEVLSAAVPKDIDAVEALRQ